jgi:hypothetical protein
MSCVLRVSAADLEARLEAVTVRPYRVEQGTAHFLVSDSSFDDFPGQVDDALEFLRKYSREFRSLLAAGGAVATLDFAVEYWEPGFFTRSFPAALVAAAADAGLGLDLSAYPSGGTHAV